MAFSAVTPCNDLDRLDPTARTPATAPFQLADVVARFRLVCPALNLLLGHHANMGATCTHSCYDQGMSKVVQIRDVPDEVHDALVEAASDQGLSLTKYVLRELEHVASRAQIVRSNAAIVRQTQEAVRGRPERETILSVLHEGRGD
jgi:hypothetical protein